jgi:hypothetical protein
VSGRADKRAVKASIKLAVVALCSVVVTAWGQGRILWDESVNGPLPFYTAAQQFGDLSIGTNSVIGSVALTPTGSSFWAEDDAFLFSVPPSLRVTQILFTANRQSLFWLGDGGWGNQIRYAESPVNGDLLPQMRDNYLPAPLSSLPAGPYSAYVTDWEGWVPERVVDDYRIDFVVEAVPEPAPFLLTALGVAVFLFRRKTKRAAGSLQPLW